MIKGNLLIVDDEPLLIQSLQYTLKKSADSVLTACNGEEALSVLLSHEIHCILCDINMPIMNGVELIRRIRADKIETPFIFYTGHGSHELMLEAVKYGAFEFLNKPQMEGLVEVVERGLKKGLGLLDDSVDSKDFMTEYKKLLSQIE